MDGHIPLAKLKARNRNAFPAVTGGQVDNSVALFFRLRGKTACQGDWDIQVGKLRGNLSDATWANWRNLAGNIRVCVIWAKSGRLAGSERAGGDVDWRQLTAALDAARLESPDLAALGDGRRIVDALLQHGLIRAD